MTASRLLRLALCLVGAAMMGFGCSRPAGRIACYPVKGRVLYQGKPLAGMMVIFYPVNPPARNSPSASGLTDEDGWFTLSSYETDDGAPAGEYDVGIGRESAFRRQKGGLRKGKEADPDPLKGRYQDPRKSNIRVRIEEKNNELAPINLK